MTANVSLAEDCAQQAFIRAWQHLGEFRGESEFSTWLHRIAVNEVLAAGRREGRYRDVMREFANEALTDTQLGTPPTDSHDPDLEQAIAKLPQRARQVLCVARGLWLSTRRGGADVRHGCRHQQGTLSPRAWAVAGGAWGHR